MGSNKSVLSRFLHKNLSKTLLLVKICWGHGVLRNSNRQDKLKEWLWIPPWNSSTPSLCTAEKQPPHNQIWSPLHQTLYSALCTLQTIVFNRSEEFRGTVSAPSGASRCTMGSVNNQYNKHDHIFIDISLKFKGREVLVMIHCTGGGGGSNCLFNVLASCIQQNCSLRWILL